MTTSLRRTMVKPAHGRWRRAQGKAVRAAYRALPMQRGTAGCARSRRAGPAPKHRLGAVFRRRTAAALMLPDSRAVAAKRAASAAAAKRVTAVAAKRAAAARR